MNDWRKSMIAKVKIAQKQLGMSDADYRAVLDAQFGVASCTKLTNRQLDELIRHFSAKGFVERTVRVRKGDKSVPSEKAMNAKAMLSKIEALLAEIGTREGRHVPWDYAAAILKRMYKVDKLEWAKPEQLRSVIAALHNKAYGSTPEQMAESLLSVRRENPENYEFMRGIILGGVGVRKRAQVEQLVSQALNKSSIQTAPVQQNG